MYVCVNTGEGEFLMIIQPAAALILPRVYSYECTCHGMGIYLIQWTCKSCYLLYNSANLPCCTTERSAIQNSLSVHSNGAPDTDADRPYIGTVANSNMP